MSVRNGAVRRLSPKCSACIPRYAGLLRDHGIKAIGNAVFKRLRPGLIYLFKIGADGHVYPETVLDM